MMSRLIKNVIAVALPILILTGCDKHASQRTGVWSLQERVDKISGERIIEASALLDDKDTPSVFVETSLVCRGGKKLELHVKTLGELQKNGTRPELPLREGSVDGLSHDIFIKARNGGVVLDFAGFIGDFDNVATFGLKAYSPANFYREQISDREIFLKNYEFFESSAFMKEKDLYLRVPILGAQPTVKINLDDPSVKKASLACNFASGKGDLPILNKVLAIKGNRDINEKVIALSSGTEPKYWYNLAERLLNVAFITTKYLEATTQTAAPFDYISLRVEHDRVQLDYGKEEFKINFSSSANLPSISWLPQDPAALVAVKIVADISEKFETYAGAQSYKIMEGRKSIGRSSLSGLLTNNPPRQISEEMSYAKSSELDGSNVIRSIKLAAKKQN